MVLYRNKVISGLLLWVCLVVIAISCRIRSWPLLGSLAEAVSSGATQGASTQMQWKVHSSSLTQLQCFHAIVPAIISAYASHWRNCDLVGNFFFFLITFILFLFMGMDMLHCYMLIKCKSLCRNLWENIYECNIYCTISTTFLLYFISCIECF